MLDRLHTLSFVDQCAARAMLACYRSQAAVLARFTLDAERVRAAPAYDFGAPPPASAFHYDAFAWPLRGADFVRHAQAALARGIGSHRPGA